MGTISITKNGKFRARVRQGIYKNNAITKTFSSKITAKKWIRSIEFKLDKTNTIAKKVDNFPNLSSLIRRYLDEVSVKKASHQTDKFNFRTFLKLFENPKIPIDELNVQMFANFRDKYLINHKPSTYQRLMSSIKHMWTIAQTEWEYPLQDIFSRLQKVKRGNPRNRRLSDKEYQLLLFGNHTDSEFKKIIELAIHTALRLGEILNIDRPHIKENTLTVIKRKNGDTNIDIPLSKRAKELLGSMDLPIKLKKRGVQIKWQRLIKKYGIKNLHFHDLRHEAISRYLEKGLTIQDVQVLSGHKDVRILMRVYANLKAEKIAHKLN